MKKGRKEHMSGENIFTTTTLQPIVEALQSAITTTDIVNLFTSGVVIALPLILVWFGARWVYRRFTNAVQGGQD